jgi:hypothetical protein
MAFDPKDTKETAAFNLAQLYLDRINQILGSNYIAMTNGDIRRYRINLTQLYQELYPWLVIDTRKGNEVNEVIVLENGFKELAKLPRNQLDKIWDKMVEIERIMRAHLKAKGMLMPKLTDPRFLFGNKQK